MPSSPPLFATFILSVSYFTYHVDDLGLSHLVLFELCQELTRLHGVATEEVRKASEHVHYFRRLNVVVEFKESKDLGHLFLQVDAKQLGAVESVLDGIFFFDSMFGEKLIYALDVSFRLVEQVWVPEDQRS